MNSKDSAPAPVVIPIERLAEETLWALIEDFVTREGTDYGQSETAIGTKKEQVLQQLKSGHAGIVYFPGDESFTLLTHLEIQQRGL